MAVDYSFIDCHIAKENIGEHDGDNRFLIADIGHQIEAWQEDHKGCTIVGICYEDPHPFYKGYYPMVYEDENGNRFWTHWNPGTLNEYVEAGLIPPLQGVKYDSN